MKVLALYADNAGCGFVRIKLPYTALAQLPGIAGPAFEVTIADRISKDTINEFDIVVLQRPGNNWSLPIAEWCNEHKIPLVIELDDICWALPEWNPFADEWNSNAEGTQEISWKIQQQTLGLAQACTVTTQALAEEVKPYQPNVFVIPNYIDIEMFDNPNHDRKPVTIGWSGSHSHLKDVKSIAGLVGSVMTKHPDTHMLTIGGYPPAEVAFKQGIPNSRFTGLPWIDNFMQLYQAHSFMDIGLCPLVDDRFNGAKSWNKVNEYGAVGAPVICSDTGPYHDFVKPDFGYLVKSKYDWKEALHDLLSNPEKRLQMGLRAREVAEENDIRRNVYLWKDMLESVVQTYGEKSPTTKEVTNAID